MADTRDTIRDGVRDTVRDTGNAVRRNVGTQDNTSMIAMVVGAVAVLLVALYAFGMFGGTTTTTNTTTDDTGRSTTTTTPN